MQTITTEYLDTHVVKNETRGRKCICPACLGNDLWDTSSLNGRVHCFNCGTNFRTNTREYEEYVPPQPHPNIEGIRAYYATVAGTYHGCLSPEHEEYLKRRGIDKEGIETFGIGFCPDSIMSLYDHPLAIDSGVARKDKHPILGDRIVFQYRGEGKVTDLRGRIFRGDGMKYKGLFSSSVRRGANYPFNYDRAMEKAQEQKRIILTEGEMKAILADQHGFPCVALPGMVSWRPLIVPADWKVIVIFDNSKISIDRMRIDRAIERVYTKLPSIYVGTLPLEKDDKQDIDSFLLGRGDRARWFEQILDNSLPYNEYKRLRRF